MEAEVHASRGGAREVHRLACFSHKKMDISLQRRLQHLHT